MTPLLFSTISSSKLQSQWIFGGGYQVGSNAVYVLGDMSFRSFFSALSVPLPQAARRGGCQSVNRARTARHICVDELSVCLLVLLTL